MMIEWLFDEKKHDDTLFYTLDFVRRTGGELLVLLESRSAAEAAIRMSSIRSPTTLEDFTVKQGMMFQTQPAGLDVSNQSFRFKPAKPYHHLGDRSKIA